MGSIFEKKIYEAFRAFKRFKVFVEKEPWNKTKILRTDHGGEFNSKKLTCFCAMNESRRQLRTTYTPQQNAVSERKICTILNMVRSMLATRRIPNFF